jgi:polysaccharide export outer membrane protein
MTERLRQRVLLAGLLAIVGGFGQSQTELKTAGKDIPPAKSDVRSTYLVGPNDQLTVHITEMEDSERVVRITPEGYINLPMIGRVRAAGLTVAELESDLTKKMGAFVRRPQVSVDIKEFRSQNVSIIGAVNKPGVHQLEGQKTLIEMLSSAEGLRPDAGYSVRITRELKYGRIPLPNAKDDEGKLFSVAELSLKNIMESKNPADNIIVQPNDVISVPRAEMVYVIGEVKKSGGFVLTERKSISVLQALSLAEGVLPTGSPQNAKILRAAADGASRGETTINVKKLLAGKSVDVGLNADDILFIPTNAVKRAGIRALEAAIQTGTGLLIYRPR